MSAKITAALHEIMSKVGYVQKTGKNAFHGYKYAGEADLLAVLRPAMVEAGLLLIPSLVEHGKIDEHGNKDVVLEYTLVHRDGDIWPDKIRAIGTGNDRNKNGVGDKGTYKALTGANKYLLFKLFQIETGDDPERDSDHEKDPPANKAKTPPPASNPKQADLDYWKVYVDNLVERIAEQPDMRFLADLWVEETPELQKLKAFSPKAYGGIVDRFQKRGLKEAE